MRLLALLLAAGVLAGCSGGSGPPASLISILPDNPNRPYVVTAIDYHFHDAHPTRPIAVGRTLIVTNDGLNLHNVTIPAAHYSMDVKPGGRLVIKDIGALLGGPGRYPFFCAFHVNLGMKGVIVIAG